jgi:small-conductance mechanosensitive channel
MNHAVIDPNLLFILLKIVFIIGALFYLVYTFVVFRQVQVMKKTLITNFSLSINLLSLINLFLALALFVGFLLLL